MGYDLTFRPRPGDTELDAETFVLWFQERDNCTFSENDEDLVGYFSEITNVYFTFRHHPPDDDEPRGAIHFSINYYRPHTFALEAVPELQALADGLDLEVEDFQNDGIDGSTFEAAAFLRGWTAGNRSAYEAVLTGDDGPDVEPHHLPRDVVERIWRWNNEFDSVEEENGGTYVAELVGYVARDGRVATITSLDVDKATLLPRVDLVHVVRQGKSLQASFVPWDELYETLGLREDGCIDDPWPYWAITRTEASAAQKFLRGKDEPSPVDSIDVAAVHVTEDVAPFLGQRATK
jgi:hypothetical protein